MNRMFTALFLMLYSFQLNAQKIIYSEIINEDRQDINFEILGKVGNNYVIYKFVRWKHMLAVYDENMHIKSNQRIDFIPDKTFNVDFIVYPDHFLMIYQYQKRNTIYCKAVKMNAAGQLMSQPVTLDTSRVGLIADKKIYSTVFSEDRKNILVYKMQKKNEKLTIVTKLYDPSLTMIDSTRHVVPFDERRDAYSDMVVDNKGNIIFAKEYKTGWQDNVARLEMVVGKPGEDTFKTFEIPLAEKYIDELNIKIDNLNGVYIINSLFNKKKNGSIDGLFTALIKQGEYSFKSAFNVFDDSMRIKINSEEQYAYAFNNLFLRNTVVKRDGGFVITAEDYYVQSNNNRWRRYDNIYRPYSSNNDYYLSSPSYNRYYRPYNQSSYNNTTRYFYNDIIILSLDSSLHITWNNIIHKKQNDSEQDNFLSYATINAGSEIHFLFIDNNKNQVINNHSILPNGQVNRYATLKSYEAGFEFMPKLSKQVGPRQLIMPCVYRGSIAFAKVDFSE